jgi:heparin/heparan-sulfate lyase
LPQLRKQAAAYPAEWERMKDVALRAPSDPGYGDGRAVRTAALVYLITGEELYLRSAAAMAENIARYHQLDRYATPEALFGLALAYDWCYSGLTPEQRAEMARAMLHQVEYLDREIWRHSDFNNHFVLEKVWPFVFTGLALHGDVADPRVDGYLRRGDEYLHQNLLPAANLMAGDTGGQFEGYGYDSWGYARPLAYVLEAWRTATQEDLFPVCTATRNFALWNIYGRRPHDGKQEHFDDAGLGQAWGTEDAYVCLFAARYRDGRAQWMGDQLTREYDSALWPILLWRDPDLAPQPPADLPTARRFEPLGWVLMRSSWEPGATFASFQCGPFYTGHQHLDNNAFTIHKRGLLALDSGLNAYGERVDDRYRTNYYSRTIAHNTVTVYDPNETFPGGPWASGEPGAANDGGQLRLLNPERVQEVTPENRWQVGRLAAYTHDDLCTYAVGDATKSYSPAKLTRFLRHFLYLPPDLFIVFDRVVSTDASFRKAWLLHTVNEPKVEGAIASITEGDGRLVCRTVLPEQATLSTVGGPGKECWVDGRNWPSQEKKEWPPEAGSWRLEVSPAQPATEDFFLHVLQAGGDEIAKPEAVRLIREEDMLGVRVQAQGREYTAMFSTRGEARGRVKIVEEGRVVEEREVR